MTAVAFIGHLFGALLVRTNSGAGFVGPNGGPWLEFVEKLSATGNDAAMRYLRAILMTATDSPAALTPEQLKSAGVSARRLLEFAWATKPRNTQLVVAALNAVCNTFASDVAASALLLRRALEPDHLAAFGHEELHWLSRQVRALADHDIDLVVSIYEAAYGHEEKSDEVTAMGGSRLLSLTSNRRQDYESSWYGLSEAVPQIFAKNPIGATRLTIRALAGYVKRRHSKATDEKTAPQQFAMGNGSATLHEDHSYSWFGGGIKSRRDAPVLLEKFEAAITALAELDDASGQFATLLKVAADEAGLAAIWATFLRVGALHPAKLADLLFPLANAIPLMTSFDTRYDLGEFVRAAYQDFSKGQRETIEATILGLQGEAANYSRRILIGCVPEPLIATQEFRDARDALATKDAIVSNRPPIQISSSMKTYTSEDYLADEGVATKDKQNAELLALMKRVEAARRTAYGDPVDASVVRETATLLDELRVAISEGTAKKLPETLVNHVTGVLGEKASRLAALDKEFIREPDVRKSLKQALLVASTSASPAFSQEEEDAFQDSVSWGGPSARAAAGEGLLRLVRFDDEADTEILPVIRVLARDPVAHVRLHVVQRLMWLHKIDGQWMWQEVGHAILQEKTRGVVGTAIATLSHLVPLDRGKAIEIAKKLLARYAGVTGPGIEHCVEMATTLIHDLYIYSDNQEAGEFWRATLGDFVVNAETIKQMIARYSGALVPPDDGANSDAAKKSSAKALAFYDEALTSASAEANKLAAKLDLAKFGQWSSSEQEALRSLYGIADEICLRLFFVLGGRDERGQSALTEQQLTLFEKTRPLLEKLSAIAVASVAHHLVEMLERYIEVDPPFVFRLISQTVRAAETAGYGYERMAVDLVVRIVERYLADYRGLFVEEDNLKNLMACLDVFVKAGWPSAQALTYRLGEIWR